MRNQFFTYINHIKMVVFILSGNVTTTPSRCFLYFCNEDGSGFINIFRNLMENRKKDHIELAFESGMEAILADKRFWYEPMLGTHTGDFFQPIRFAGRTMQVPVWVSSMTGGSSEAATINRNLARACREFGMGMGLGSCRILLENPNHFPDFDVRMILGDEVPLFANIGIVQLEEMVREGTTGRLEELVARLQCDGLIIHVNPLQEFLQKEGDRLTRPAIKTIETFLSGTRLKIIVKEVGQGMGPASTRRLLALPLEAFEFAAFGGTNFSTLEISRDRSGTSDIYSPLTRIGHPCGEMLETVNNLIRTGFQPVCRNLIISGGIRSFLDGYYYISKSLLPSVYGQAGGFLKYARGDYEQLQAYVAGQIRGLQFAKEFLQIKS